MARRSKIIEVPAEVHALPQFALPDHVKAVEPEPSLPLAEDDGIYFGLDAEAQYHPSSGLGSGDVKRLFQNPSEFWWNSAMNAMKPEDADDSPFKIFGRAVHIRVLEGEEKFNSLYEREYTGKDLIKTDAQLRKWIIDNGDTPAKGNKPERIAQALAMDPEVKIAEAIKSAAEAAGRTILKEEAFARILISSKMITDNPDLDVAFSNGMPEVAIVWTEIVDGEPVKCKALLDYLKIKGIGDLKSTSNPKELDFPQLCKIRFSEWRSDVQAAHYLRAREHVAQFVQEGRVFGDHDPEWLARVAAQTAFGFAFVFFQSTGAPSTWATSLWPEHEKSDPETGEVETVTGNPILELGAMARDEALHNYVKNRRQFGTDMWLKHEPMKELDITDLPMWFARRGAR